MVRRKWQDIAHDVQNHRARTLARVQPPIPDIPSPLPLNVTAIPQALLSTKEVEITTARAEDLIDSLATGKLTCVEVTQAFLRSACLAQKLVHLLKLSSNWGADFRDRLIVSQSFCLKGL